MNLLPESFISTIKGVHQEKGELWLEKLDSLIQYCEQRWSCQVLAPYPLSYHFVAPIRFNKGTEAVLKLGVPGKEMIHEVEALRLYKGNGCAQLWDSDTAKGILVLERANPGHTLKAVADDEEATLLAAAVMRKLQVRPPIQPLFPSTLDWSKGLQKLRSRYNGGTGPLPEPMVRKAEDYFAKLHASWRNVQLLHGDLHHENILAAEREPYIAIDPKGVIGEPEYGVIPFLINHLPEHNAIDVIRRRIELFTEELSLNKTRIIAWGYSHSVLSAWWFVEDQLDGFEQELSKALIFEKLMEEVQDEC
ncbi:aminoglycoside phosphotransferase family protein [Paenibacillus agricola]|uniref:Kinase n=1 Tax=Paenibacillus agricola TaxID=2716264 RepID=A0ABX0J4B0_9BACL|nr:aminoglycoside phosphotransferase family protein [Paenibacillus agricola]NHN28854.1 kinase [Paenibacillus agricola]